VAGYDRKGLIMKNKVTQRPFHAIYLRDFLTLFILSFID